jgi:hypothetical protein
MTDQESTFRLSSGPDRTAHRVVPVLPGEHLLLSLLDVLFFFFFFHGFSPLERLSSLLLSRCCKLLRYHRPAHGDDPALAVHQLPGGHFPDVFRFPGLSHGTASSGCCTVLTEDGRSLVLVVGTTRRIAWDPRGTFARQGALGGHVRLCSHRQPARHDFCLSFGVGVFFFLSGLP